MKNILMTLLVLLNVVIGKSYATTNDVLPKPQHVAYTKCGNFIINQPIRLVVPTIGENDPAIGTELTALISQHGGTVTETADATVTVELVSSIPEAEFQNEAYTISSCAEGVSIKAVTLQGAYWAVQTLWQMAEGNGNSIESCQITDWAAFKVRGYMHDIGRSYMEFDELKNQILRLSRYKVNVFHWHLTDNQGWRLQSQVYTQLNANDSFTRFPGKYYTIQQAKELVQFALQHGVTIIPEIDMPGHSEAFRKAMGHSMLTAQGLAEMKAIMTEACQTFANTEWMHIGSDEVRAVDTEGATMTAAEFITEMTTHIRTLGKKIVVWNPGHGYNASQIDMTQMWSSRGAPTNGIPAIDSRYHYINHYDQYADIVSLYNSTIAGQQKGSRQYAGTIIGIWNDRILPTDRDIVVQNAFYQSMLAMVERAWRGGGTGYFTEIGTTFDPTDMNFADWERRFLYHKANYLRNEPIAYVKQTNVRWRITDQFPNNGNTATRFPPENALTDTYTYNGATYNTRTATGAGIYLRHVWGTLIPTFYANPKANHTAYAYTYVYSPAQQTVGVQIEFQNYGRSESDLPPPAGAWDYNGSKIWVNDVAVNPPNWKNTHTTKSNEIALENENFTARTPMSLTLNQGWNKVLIKLPNKGFNLNAVRLVKWMFTCVFVTTDGKNAVDGLIYSPDKNMNPSLDILNAAIDKAIRLKKSISVGEEPGYYSHQNVNELTEKINQAIAMKDNAGLADEEYNEVAQTLITYLGHFKRKINLPKISNETTQYWYSLSTPLRTNNGYNFVTFKGNNTALKGEIFSATNDNQLWKFTQNEDGTLNIVPKSSESHLDAGSVFNTALKVQTGVTSASGWATIPIFTNAYFIITSGTTQLNQTTSGLSYQIYNWGNGSNTTDAGCVYQIRTEMVVGATLKSQLQAAINNAYGKTYSVAVGEQPGEYAQANIDAFKAKISEAETVWGNAAATETQLQTALSTLQAETTAFLQNINLPKPSIGDNAYWYTLTSVRENRAVAYQGENATLLGESYLAEEDKFLWKLVPLQDATYSLVNKSSENYITTATPKLTAQSGTQTSKGWSFKPLYDGKLFIITSGTSQFNQGNSGTQYAVNNWGSGVNTTDEGCQYIVTLAGSELSGTDDITTEKEIKIWFENGFLKSNIPTERLTVYSITGQQLDQHQKFSESVIIVKTSFGARKIVVN